ncbi:transcriptional regulator [Halorarius litoreus]|uniref:transcriptional regulator n=1 Tax=Halorarius litoreus TaxID=2962676 RepID=UPI0020CFDD64|nr:transcriptional regulator [Halorarius litoreus]
MATVSQTLSFDDILDALAHVQRRKLLVALLDHNPQDDVPVVVDASESDTEALQRLIMMKHSHLPKLERYGFIDRNQETKEVSKGPNFEEIRPVLEVLLENEGELPSGWL